MKCLRIYQSEPYKSYYTDQEIVIKVPIKKDGNKAFKLYSIYDVSFDCNGSKKPAIAFHISNGDCTPIAELDADDSYDIVMTFNSINSRLQETHFSKPKDSLIVVILNEKPDDFNYSTLDDIINELNKIFTQNHPPSEDFTLKLPDSFVPRESGGGVIIPGG